MAGTVFAPDSFYRVLTARRIHEDDAKAVFGPVDLVPGDVVWCSKILRYHAGAAGRGRYALMHVKLGAQNVEFWHRLSKNNIGAGDWEKMNEMEVLALASVLPLD